MSRVTVALLTYNRPKYLRQAIDAVLAQSYKDFEFLICDNGSTAETQEIIKSYTDQRIVYVRNEVNTREFYNAPFYISKGEYLLITHDDDIMFENFLSKEVETLDSNESIVAVGCNVSQIDEGGRIIKARLYNVTDNFIFNQDEYLKSYFKNVALPCPTVLMRKKFFLKHDLKFDFSVGPGADQYLWFSVLRHPVQLCLLSEILYAYRVHTQQDSALNSISLHLQLYNALLQSTVGLKRYLHERKQLVLQLLYLHFFQFSQRSISYTNYKKKLKELNKKHSDTRLYIKVLLYQVSPFAIKQILKIKTRFIHKR